MSCESANLNLTVVQNTNFDDSVLIRDADTQTPFDLTGYSARMQVRREINDTTPVFDWSSADGELVMGGVLGTITWDISAAETAVPEVDWDGELWVYDLLLTSPSGDVDRALYGTITIYGSSTRP